MKTAAIVLIGVVVLFFFPAPRGSFVSTHGPMTSIQSQYESITVWLFLALAGLRRGLVPALSSVGRCSWAASEPPAREYSPGFSILRI